MFRFTKGRASKAFKSAEAEWTVRTCAVTRRALPEGSVHPSGASKGEAHTSSLSTGGP